MPELTLQDRESYQKLHSAANNLSKKILNSKPQTGLTELTTAFSGRLLELKDLSSFDQLQILVELTGSYLTIYQLFPEAIPENKQDDVNKASQELSIQYRQLKASLEAVDNDFLEDLTIPSSDPLFLGFLKDSSPSKVKIWTQQILSDRPPELTDEEVRKLVDAWGKAVAGFAEDARKVVPGEAKTIAHFFLIHDQLEELYSELSTSVALNS